MAGVVGSGGTAAFDEAAGGASPRAGVVVGVVVVFSVGAEPG